MGTEEMEEMVFFQSIESVISIILMIGLGYVLKSLGGLMNSLGEVSLP